jgi:hypothetical protein
VRREFGYHPVLSFRPTGFTVYVTCVGDSGGASGVGFGVGDGDRVGTGLGVADTGVGIASADAAAARDASVGVGVVVALPQPATRVTARMSAAKRTIRKRANEVSSGNTARSPWRRSALTHVTSLGVSVIGTAPYGAR